MKNTNTVRTEIHYAQVEEYQLPLLTLPQTDDTELLASMAGCGWPISRISVLCCTTGCC